MSLKNSGWLILITLDVVLGVTVEMGTFILMESEVAEADVPG
jgi:hypothetical protein